MGLFSRKPKELVYDAAECQSKKARMREMFNEAVEEGDSYEILRATETSSKFEHGFVFDTNTTTYYYYILGYRKSDGKVVMVQIDRELKQHSDAFFVDMDAVVGVNYYPKLKQACLIYKKGYGSYGEILNIYDTGSKTASGIGITNIVQEQEREGFLDFLEGVRSRLEQAGHKQEKWKR
ncbi:MAG: hypothetical protein K2I22_09030 [Lachnospiraceae bacterium]|nr:hypothetical protein [Lachnospiraceae bacterium]